MAKGNRKKRIVLEYNSKDYCSLQRYQSFFKNYLVAGNKIPARTIIKFLSHFNLPELEQEKIIAEQRKSVSTMTVDRFKDDKEYNFKYTNPKTKRVASFEKMIPEIINRVCNVNITYTKEKYVQEKLAQELCNAFYLYRRANLNATNRKKLSDYKIYVIVCFIVNHLGHRFTKLDATKPVMFAKIRYTLDKCVDYKNIKPFKKSDIAFDDVFK